MHPHKKNHRPLLKGKDVMAWTIFTDILSLFDLWVKGQGQMNVIIVHDISSNGHAHTYQISLTDLERQKCYGQYKLCQLFYPGVKGQGQLDIMMVQNTPTNGPVPTYQMSLTYLERKKS